MRSVESHLGQRLLLASATTFCVLDPVGRPAGLGLFDLGAVAGFDRTAAFAGLEFVGFALFDLGFVAGLDRTGCFAALAILALRCEVV